MNTPDDDQHSDDALSGSPTVAAQHGPPATVRLRGPRDRELLSAQPHLHVTRIPEAYRCHPLVRGQQHYYSVPEQLLSSVCRPQAGESFSVDDGLLDMEIELSRLAGGDGTIVGYWDDLPIECNLLQPTLLRQETLEQLGYLSAEQMTEILRDFNERQESFVQIACGYAGWLTTNPEFVQELNELVSQYECQIRWWGTAMVGLPIPSSQPAGLFNPTSEVCWQEYDAAVVEFCVRWRLRGLAGPRIPVPMMPMVSRRIPLTMIAQFERAGGMIHWPDTYPVFSRDELRELLVEVLQSSESTEHLAGWRRIIAVTNRAKNQIATLARRFRLQHYWRLLRERYPQAFRRRLNRVERAFGEFFGVEERTICDDRRAIEKRLGRAWDQQAPADISTNRPR